jgi:type IV secretory pathway VirB10-like protein
MISDMRPLTRLLIVWRRLIMSDGHSPRIDNVTATDPSGYAGLYKSAPKFRSR